MEDKDAMPQKEWDAMQFEEWLQYGMSPFANDHRNLDQFPGARPFVRHGSLTKEVCDFIDALNAASRENLQKAVIEMIAYVGYTMQTMQMIADLFAISRYVHVESAVLSVIQKKIEEYELDSIEDDKEKEQLFLTILAGISNISEAGDKAAESCLCAIKKSGCCRDQWKNALIDQILAFVRSEERIA